MSFRFRVGKVWPFPQLGVYHVIGLLEEGKIIPPVAAKIAELPGEIVHFDSVSLGSPLPGGQLTLVVSHLTVEPRMLEGCLLSDT
jgi:hypothetical protein